MKAWIDVVDENERDLIAQGLADPSTRALVKMIGALLPLRMDQQARVLNDVCQQLDISL